MTLSLPQRFWSLLAGMVCSSLNSGFPPLLPWSKPPTHPSHLGYCNSLWTVSALFLIVLQIYYSLLKNLPRHMWNEIWTPYHGLHGPTCAGLCFLQPFKLSPQSLHPRYTRYSCHVLNMTSFLHLPFSVCSSRIYSLFLLHSSFCSMSLSQRGLPRHPV